MATNKKALIEKREELKRRLAAGEYKTLIDVFLGWFNGVLQKTTRRSKPFSTWVVIVSLMLVIGLLSYGTFYISGGFNLLRNYYTQLNGSGYGWLGFLVFNLFPLIVIVVAVLLNQSIHRIFKLWQEDILDTTDSITSLDKIENWLGIICNRRLHLLGAIIGGLVFSLYSLVFMSAQLGENVGGVWAIMVTYVSVLVMIFLYNFAMVIFLSILLHQYDMKLFAADPASSELLSRLSAEFKFIVNIVAFYAALITFINIIGFASIDVTNNILLVLTLWLPISAMFVLSQTSLASIVRQAKWKTLNDIQAKVEKIQSSKNFESQENMDTFIRLLDYHDRIKRTRNSSLDLRAILNYINSLLLPPTCIFSRQS